MKKICSWVLCVFCTVFLCFSTCTADCQAAVYTAPVITKQPENYYGEYGQTIHFSVEVSVTEGYYTYYQWFYRPAGATTWYKVVGATSSTVNSVFYKGMDNWQVACVISDGKTLCVTDFVEVCYQEKEVSVPDTQEDQTTEDQTTEDQTTEDQTTGDSSSDDQSAAVDTESTDNPFNEDIPDEEIQDAEENDTVIDEAVPDEGSKDLPDNVTVEDQIEENKSEENQTGETVTDEDQTGETVTDESQTGDTSSVTEPTEETGTEESVQPEDSSREYVTPEQFGAKGDGVTDDSAAIQAAVDSGKDVVFSDKTYYIAADKYILIQNKTDFHMSGGTIHKAASPSNYNLFVLRNCSDCTFENMYIYSELTCTDITVPNGHTRPTGLSSNVLAFSGTGNSDIQFLNNRFDNLSADYWFNGNLRGTWKNITVDGWTSSTSLLPMYAQFITGLTVTNANVSMNPTAAGNGDHCIYMCTLATGIRISDSNFNWYGSYSNSGMIAVLTFHGGNASQNSQPNDIVISNCNINSGEGKAVYAGEGVTVTAENCTVSSSTDAGLSDLYLFSGYGSFVINNSQLTGYDTLLDDQTGSFSLTDCTLTGASANGIFGTAKTVKCDTCTFNISKGVLYYTRSGSGVSHTYKNCTINKTEKGLGYIVSRRTAAGSILFEECKIDCGGGMFMYNGGSANMTGVSLINTNIFNSSMFGISAELSGLSVTNSTFNGSSI